CKDSTNFVIGEPTAPISGSFTDTTNATCFGADDGTATYTPQGGTSPYSYTWSAGTGSNLNPVRTGLNPGFLYVTVTDVNSCPSYVDSALVTEPNPLTVQLVNLNPAGCSGGSAG